MPFPAHISALYDDVVENIRFAKLQQWRVINYALLIYAAIYFVRDQAPLKSCAGKAALTVAIFVTWAFSILVLCSLERSIGKFRGRVAWVYQRYFTASEWRGLTLDTNIYWFDRIIVVGLLAVSTAGAALVLVLVWSYCTVPGSW